MKFSIKRQEEYSRLQLLLRFLFGIIYIGIPHIIALMFLSIGMMFVMFLAFWIVLFTGKFPRGMFDFCVKLIRWRIRLNATLTNMSDVYPAFGLDAQTDYLVFDIPYPESSNRLLLLARAFFGMIYVYIPHGICLAFLGLASAICNLLAFFAILFTGKFPEGMFNFMVGVQRWGLRVAAYMMFLTDTYPPFSMEETDPVDWNADKKIEDHLVG